MRLSGTDAANSFLRPASGGPDTARPPLQLIKQPSHRHSGPETSVAATIQFLGRQSYAFDERRRLDKRGHLQALVVEVNGKIKRTVSDIPSRDQAIFDP